MIGDSITITVAGNAKVLSRVGNPEAFSETYVLFDTLEKYELRIAHSRQKPNKDGVVYSRHLVDFTKTTYAVPGGAPEIQERSYTTLVCRDGSVVGTKDLMLGLNTWLAASSAAATVKILNWES